MAAKKGKDFSKSLGRKNMSTLIPTDDVETPANNMVRERNTKIEKQETKAIDSTVVKTFRIKKEYHDTIKAIAFWDRKKIQDVFDEAISSYIESIPKATLKKAIEEYEKRQ